MEMCGLILPSVLFCGLTGPGPSPSSSYLLSFARFAVIIFASWLMFIPAGKACSRHGQFVQQQGATIARRVANDNHVDPGSLPVRESHRKGISFSAHAWRTWCGPHIHAAIPALCGSIHTGLL